MKGFSSDLSRLIEIYSRAPPPLFLADPSHEEAGALPIVKQLLSAFEENFDNILHLCALGDAQPEPGTRILELGSLSVYTGDVLARIIGVDAPAELPSSLPSLYRPNTPVPELLTYLCRPAGPGWAAVVHRDTAEGASTLRVKTAVSAQGCTVRVLGRVLGDRARGLDLVGTPEFSLSRADRRNGATAAQGAVEGVVTRNVTAAPGCPRDVFVELYIFSEGASLVRVPSSSVVPYAGPRAKPPALQLSIARAARPAGKSTRPADWPDTPTELPAFDDSALYRTPRSGRTNVDLNASAGRASCQDLSQSLQLPALPRFE